VEPRQNHYARANTAGRITVRDLKSDRELARLDGPSPDCDWLRFSPDGRLLAARFSFRDGKALQVWEWQRSTPLFSSPLPRFDGVPVEFAPDSQSMFIGLTNGSIQQIALPEGGSLGTRPTMAVPVDDVEHSDAPLFVNEARLWMQRWLKSDTSSLPSEIEKPQKATAEALACLTNVPPDATNFRIHNQFTKTATLPNPDFKAARESRRTDLLFQLKAKVFRWFPTNNIPFEARPSTSQSGGGSARLIVTR
jgi:hypothetical protein